MIPPDAVPGTQRDRSARRRWGPGPSESSNGLPGQQKAIPSFGSTTSPPSKQEKERPGPVTHRPPALFSLGIGAQKAGTTWLYENFRLHPGIWMPPRKDWTISRRKVDLGPLAAVGEAASYIPGGWAVAAPGAPAVAALQGQPRRGRGRLVPAILPRDIPSDDRYGSSFRPEPGILIAGQFPPDYAVLSESQVKRVAAMVPGARILFFMRNPIERARASACREIVVVGKRPRTPRPWLCTSPGHGHWRIPTTCRP